MHTLTPSHTIRPMADIDEWIEAVPSPRLRRGIARHLRELEAENQRLSSLLARTVELSMAQGVLTVAEQALDGVVGVLDAERGFVGLFEPDGAWRLVAARHMTQSDIEDPEGQVSRSYITSCRETRQPVVEVDALEGPYAARQSVSHLQLRSVLSLIHI